MTEYKYALKRSRRRSICIKIGTDNTLEVTAPLITSVDEIEKFIRSKSGWIDRHVKQNAEKREFLEDVISLKKILVSGTAVPLYIGEKDLLCEDFVAVKSISRLKKVFTDALGGRFLDIFNEIKSQHGFVCGKVTFRDYKSRWGSCFAGGDIVFNYKLLMLPRDIQVYVMVHELCHTLEMNHSQRFYALVARVLPDYKDIQKRLNPFSPIVVLY